ncbi:hypothetical protein JCM18694_31390 [Prolixibacter denitrificans]|uniref:Uncharacterized protein n=1 Tax=Prolixibacter denitrificans TaxID=1541063 RepID=A0ABQ0ZNA5_9BACT|nr:hypothetical protein JCM18694_31390 [Prolixibacter denitrificans]
MVIVLRTFTVLVAGLVMMRSGNPENLRCILVLHIADLFRFAGANRFSVPDTVVVNKDGG